MKLPKIELPTAVAIIAFAIVMFLGWFFKMGIWK
jgi:hypothetical protein